MVKKDGSRSSMFRDWSMARKLWESVGGAVVTGALCGVAAAFSLWAYIPLVLLSAIGGFPAGMQHRTLWGALLRGAVGGLTWAAALIVAFLLTGRAAAVALPDPIIGMLLWGVIPACVVAAVSWAVGSRRRRRTAPAGAVLS